MNISSYQTNIDFGTLIKSITFLQNPKKIVEFGILKGFSLQCFVDTVNHNCKIEAYDIFEDFQGNSANKNIIENFKKYDNVSINYGDYYNQYKNILDNSIDILHIDIANNGDVYNFCIDKYLSKITSNGIILLEGGSEKRDNVDWMIKYNKRKIVPVINELKKRNDLLIYVIEEFPSLTIIKNK